MIVTQTEIDAPTGSLVMSDIRILSLIITQMRLLNLLYEPVTLTAISLVSQSPTSCLTLQTRFDSVRNLEIRELNTLYSMDELHPAKGVGLGENILGAIATSLIFISALRARVITMARSLIYP
jgi:hypothetical protein